MLHRFGLRNSDKVTTKEAHWNRDSAFVNRPDMNKKVPAAIVAMSPLAENGAGVNASPPPAAPLAIPAPDATPAFGAMFGAPAAGMFGAPAAGMFDAPAAGGAAPALPGLFNMSSAGQFQWS